MQQKPKDGGDVMNVNSVTSLSQSSYLTYKTGQSNSAFASIANIQTDVTNTKSSNFFLNSSQYSYTSSDDLLKNVLSSRFAEQKKTLATLKEYSQKSEKFYSNFFPEMNDLKTSASTLADTDFSSKNTSSIVKNVKQFASDYSSAVDFLSSNKSVSTGVSNLATSFSSTKYNSRAYDSIGIKVDTSGRLTVDESKLTSALTSDADRVKELLGGSSGLASKTISRVNVAETNSSNLVPFPNISNRAYNGITQGMLLDIFA
ncbi:MAG: flagellar capping protein [Massilibacillus sp.]|nr:flagellar capping protein [Massilibacillus sp.]